MQIRKSLIIFYDSDSNIFIQDRRTIHKSGKPYGFFGGSIEGTETPDEAIIREVREELNISLSNFILFKELKERDGENEIEFYIYLAPIPENDIMTVKEGEKIFISIREALKLDLSERDKRILNYFYQYGKANRIL